MDTNIITHAPANYQCPFCCIARSDFGREGVPTSPQDVILRTGDVVAFIASHWWPNNSGHVLVIPAEHVENMFGLSMFLAAEIHEAARHVALAMRRAYGCEGISTRQHNEPAGGQDIWHYHLHLFPRFANDNLDLNDRDKRQISPIERLRYAELLRNELDFQGRPQRR